MEIPRAAHLLSQLPRNSPNYGILILAPAGQQKPVINGDGMWIPPLWTEEPGFIGEMVLVKNKGRRKWIMVSGW